MYQVNKIHRIRYSESFIVRMDQDREGKEKKRMAIYQKDTQLHQHKIQIKM